MTATIPQAFALAVQHHQAGRLGEAEALYRQILSAQPDHAEARHFLGVIAHQVGRNDLAVEWIREALVLAPDNAAAYSNLGESYRASGRFDEAFASFRRALELKPDDAKAQNNLGNVFLDQGRLGEAVAAYRRALALQPAFAEAHNNLGNALAEEGRLDEAVTAYGRALEIRPGYAEAHLNLGNVFRERSRLDEAVDAYRRAIQLNPSLAQAYNNLGNALKEQGEWDEAIAAYRHALQLQPDHAKVRSNLIYTLHFHPGLDHRTIAEEQQLWNRQVGEPLKRFIQPHANARGPARRLRIGYVSPDFHSHSVSFFFVPLLEAHDRRLFEIYCYASDRRSDSVTERLQKSADVWRDVWALSDAQLAECVRNDGIDILVDLAMHTTNNRLAVFARHPAPVQVSWLAYPGSTGVEAIDYRLTDAHIDPIDEEGAGLGGQGVRLPDSWCCYAPIEEFPPVSPLPAVRNKAVTFGSLNQFGKIHEGVLRCWARLLRTVPDSRLFMICPEGRTQERTRALFAAQGIEPGRVELVAPCSWTDYVRLFDKIDVALDTYPCNGMTTTCHALGMGVPVVTLVGANAVSRAGSSLLHTVGLSEWVAQSEEEYIRIVAEWAGDLPRLAEMRRTLRPKMQASPLMDAPRFARNVEAAYRSMWQQWCAESNSFPQ